MEWIAELKHIAPQMQRDIQRFCEDYSGQDFQEQQCIEGLLRSTGNFEAWVRAIPSDDAVWRWVDWPSAFDDASRSLTLIRINFEFLLMFKEQSRYVENPRPLSMHAQIAQKRINLVLDTYDQGQTKRHNFRCSFQAETEQIPAYIVIVALWPLIYRWCLDYALSLNSIEMKAWPAVLYHPYYTPITLNEIILTFARTTHDILVAAYRKEAAFEIWITHPTLRIIPTFWETLLERLDSYDAIERLREIGGSIEPLTWDEGQGQGVIVRLPWAKT